MLSYVPVNRSPRPLIFFTSHFYANITLTNSQKHSLGLFAVQSSRFREISPIFFLASRCLDHPFATFDFESTPSDCFAVPFVRSARHSAHFCPRPQHLDVNFRDHHDHSVSLNVLPFMSSPPTEPESPPRTVSSRTSPTVYAEVLSVSENNYAPAQFTFQSIDRFLLALLCICFTCFLFLNLTFALYLYFQKLTL